MVALAGLAGCRVIYWEPAACSLVFFLLGYVRGRLDWRLRELLRNPGRPRGPRPGPSPIYGGGVGKGTQPTTPKPGPR